MTDLSQKVRRTKRILEMGENTIVAKECLDCIEQTLRLLFRGYLTRLDEHDRLKVQEAEQKIGKSERGIESFTMGQLVGLFRMSHFLDAWERSSGKDLSSIRAINFDELTHLRNKFIHEDREASHPEAEFLFNCLHIIFETFDIMSAEGRTDDPFETSAADNHAAALILKEVSSSDHHGKALIFISYANPDDQTPDKLEQGEITQLAIRLKTLLSQKIATEKTSFLRIETPPDKYFRITSDTLDAIREAPILMAVLSRNYLASSWCQKGHNDFLRIVQERARNDSSVFVIEREQLNDKERLPEFAEVTGYRYPFWDKGRYNSLLNNLSYDLADELRKRKLRAEIPGRERSLVARVHPAVLLADVTDDLYAIREKVAESLRQAKLRVLPEDDYYPHDTQAFQQAVQDDLVQSKLFVQLLGSLAGRKLKGLRQSRARCQYELALEAEIPVAQWRSAELDIEEVQDSDQQALLRGKTVSTDSLETFQAEILNKLLPPKSSPGSLPPEACNIDILLFLDANTRHDHALVKSICEMLDQLGVGYMLPLQSDNPAENREAFEQYVLDCNALVVVYGEVSVKWVSDQLLAIRKICWKRQEPLTFAIFDGPPEQKPFVNIKLPNMRVLQCRNKVDEEQLVKFVASLSTES